MHNARVRIKERGEGELEEMEKGILEGMEKIAERLEDTAKRIAPNRGFLADLERVWHRWLPNKPFTVEAFKALPMQIIKETACEIMGLACEEVLRVVHEQYRASIKIATIGNLGDMLKKMASEYEVDLIMLEGELKRRKINETDIETVKRLFI